MTLLQLASAAPEKTFGIVTQLKQEAKQEPDCDRSKLVVELMEELLIRKFNNLEREEIRHMFKLHDIRDTRVWKEAVEEGKTLQMQELVKRLQDKSQTVKEISQLLGISVAEVRLLAKQ